MAETRSIIYSRSELTEILKQFGMKYQIPTIFLFGSYARNQATETSDVDIIIDSVNLHGLLALEDARSCLEDQLGKSVDMITLRSFNSEKDLPYRKAFTENVIREQVRIDV